MTINIREMSDNDTDDIMEIWLSENMAVHSFMSNEMIMKNKERTEQLIKKSKVFVCQNEDEIIGFISLSGNYIDCLYVKSKFQRQGIGKALIKHCKNIFWSLMINVYQQNETAVSFFEKQSFFVRDKMDNAETGETELFMEWIR